MRRFFDEIDTAVHRLRNAVLRFVLAGCAASIVFPLLASPAQAQPQPAGSPSTAPVRLVVGSGPGGALDILGRMIATEGAALLGRGIYVDNKPGSSGIVSAADVAHAAPDGRTFLLTTVGPLVNNAAIYRKLPYDAARDFAPVIAIGRFPLALYVRADSPYQATNDLLVDARLRPGQLNMGTLGPANLSNLAGERIAETQKVRFTAVPYNGEPAMMLALAGSQVDFVITTLGGGMGLIRGGKVRVLGMLDAVRFDMLPAVSTMAEQGLPGVEASGVPCIMAPAGTPRETIERMNHVVNQVLGMPRVRQQMHDLLMTQAGGTADDLKRLMKAEGERWIPIIQRLGIRED
jgi:tripartite-type tricarboxylate transporter receptor subunit TctC